MGEQVKICPYCGRKYPIDVEVCEVDGIRLILSSDSFSILTPGSVIVGKYEIVELIGEGGMGQVYKAIQQPIGREVALKILLPYLSRDEAVVKRFLREAKAASLLENPYTVTIYDFGQTETGILYIAMEYVRGRSLSEILEEERKLPYDMVATIIYQVCIALNEAHKKGIIHRDLKPENIMIVRDEESNFKVKVLDFGIAKMLSSQGYTQETVVTQSGIIIGTPRYLSPELAKGKQPLPQSDLYSLGVIMWEAITGSPPFEADDPITILAMHIKEPLPPFLDENTPEEFKRIIYKLLEKDPGKRFASASQLMRALKPFVYESHKEFLPEITITEVSSVKLSPLSKVIRSHKNIIYGAGILFVVVLFAIMSLLYTILPSQNSIVEKGEIKREAKVTTVEKELFSSKLLGVKENPINKKNEEESIKEDIFSESQEEETKDNNVNIIIITKPEENVRVYIGGEKVCNSTPCSYNIEKDKLPIKIVIKKKGYRTIRYTLKKALTDIVQLSFKLKRRRIRRYKPNRDELKLNIRKFE